MEPIDVEINLRSLPGSPAPKWLVEVRSVEPTAFVSVPPVSDADLAGIADLPASARTWQGFLDTLTPNRTYRPGPAALRAVGALVRDRVLGSSEVVRHLEKVERRAEQERRPIRFLLGVDEEDTLLSLLPLELAHDGTRFFFKRESRPSFRCSLLSDAQNLRLGPGSRILVATASDGQAQPSPDALAEHADGVKKVLEAAGFLAEILPEASADQLRQALLSDSPVDMLYTVCHGVEEPQEAGRLLLQGGTLSGLELARWLEEAAERQRPVQAVALCACSSAAPQNGAGTLGMAQWLVRPGRAVAALGFRGPVGVEWVLRWAERMFERFGEGTTLEEAFSYARYREEDAEPQWVLPVLYARRRDPGALNIGVSRTAPESGQFRSFPASAAPLVRSLLPGRPPRPYFTGRTADTDRLRGWLRTPGAAQITSIQGYGGIGKSELARVVAHEASAAGRPVVWLEQADQDVPGALATLLSLSRPGFQAPDGATVENLAALMRRRLGPCPGLLVLDGVSRRPEVDFLLPGGDWNVLVTTRVPELLPGVLELRLKPLASAEAVHLVARVAWNAKEPPEDEQLGVRRLTERLGRLPLALEIAAETIRHEGMTTAEYLESLDLGEGAPAEDQRRVRATLTRALRDIDAPTERAWLALGVLPSAGATAEMVATTLGEPAPVVARRLDRLVRFALATWSSETGRYSLHPLVREEARKRAEESGDLWPALHLGAAQALEELARWVHEPLNTQTGLTRERWERVRDVFDGISLDYWLQGAPGGEYIAMTVAALDPLRQDRTPSARLSLLDIAGALTQDGSEWRRANVLRVRGELHRYRGDIENAKEDLNQALALFAMAEDQPGQAATLRARGELLQYLGQPISANDDYLQALYLYRKLDDKLGQANVLLGRGTLRRHNDSDGALSDYNDALNFYRLIDNKGGQANALLTLGDLHRYSNPGVALENYNFALRLYEEIGDQIGQGNVFLARGELRRYRDDFGGALKDYEQALGKYGESEDRLGRANTFLARGSLHRQTNDFEKAAKDYDEALEIYRAVADSLGQANVLRARGIMRQYSSNPDGAQDDYREALSLFQRANSELGEANVLQAWGDLAEMHARWPEALGRYGEALRLYRQLGDFLGLGNTLVGIARVHASTGAFKEARDAAEEALRHAIPSENRYAVGVARAVLETLDDLAQEGAPPEDEAPAE